MHRIYTDKQIISILNKEEEKKYHKFIGGNNMESIEKQRIRKNTPGRMIYSEKEIKEMERKEKERIFWNKLIRGDGLGGKKGNDN